MGVAIEFSEEDLGDVHPNTVRIEIRGKSREAEISGSSIGGGVIEVFKINGFQTRFKGDSPVLLLFYRDRPGMISEVTKIIAEEGINIASLSCSRKQRGKDAFMQIDVDSPCRTRRCSGFEIPRMWMRRDIWIGFRRAQARSEPALAGDRASREGSLIDDLLPREAGYAYAGSRCHSKQSTHRYDPMIESFSHLEQLARAATLRMFFWRATSRSMQFLGIRFSKRCGAGAR